MASFLVLGKRRHPHTLSGGV